MNLDQIQVKFCSVKPLSWVSHLLLHQFCPYNFLIYLKHKFAQDTHWESTYDVAQYHN